MKGKQVTLGVVLILSALVVSGCGMPAGIEVGVPDVDVKVDVDVPEVEVEVPGVKVGIDAHKVEVQVPMVGVDVDIAGVTIDLDAPNIGISAGATSTIRGSGNVVAEGRPVRNFDRISLTGVGEVNITQGDEESLTVEADDNLMRYIKTEVRNGTLILGFTDVIRKKNIRPSEPIRFNLSVKELVGLNISGVGDVNIASLDTDRLEIVISGAGDVDVDSLAAEKLVVDINGASDVRLAGRAMEQEVTICGVGEYRAEGLNSESVEIRLPGVGSVVVWATDTLDVQIAGMGSVKYYGSPRVIQRTYGLGKVSGLGAPGQ